MHENSASNDNTNEKNGATSAASRVNRDGFGNNNINKKNSATGAAGIIGVADITGPASITDIIDAVDVTNFAYGAGTIYTVTGTADDASAHRIGRVDSGNS